MTATPPPGTGDLTTAVARILRDIADGLDDGHLELTSSAVNDADLTPSQRARHVAVTVRTRIADASSGSVDRPAALDAVEVLFAAGWDLDDVRRFPILYRQLRDRVDWAGFSGDGEHTPWLTPCEVAENIARVVNVWRGAGGR